LSYLERLLLADERDSGRRHFLKSCRVPWSGSFLEKLILNETRAEEANDIPVDIIRQIQEMSLFGISIPPL